MNAHPVASRDAPSGNSEQFHPEEIESQPGTITIPREASPETAEDSFYHNLSVWVMSRL